MNATQRLFAATVILLVLGGAAAADVSAPGTPPAAGGDVTDVARRWMKALRANDTVALAKETRFPFRLASTKECDGVAKDAAQLSSLIACLRKDAILTEELGHANDLTYEIVPAAKVPARLRRAAGKPSSIITTFINGDGITFSFYLPIGKPPTGVTAFLIDAELVE